MAKRKRQPVKKKKPVPPLRKGPLTTLKEARGQISSVPKLYKRSRDKVRAYQRLLIRAFAAKKPNRKVVTLIEKERGMAIAKMRKRNLNKLRDTTNNHLHQIGFFIKKGRPEKCKSSIAALAKNTTKRESRIVAAALEQMVSDVKVKLNLREDPKRQADYIDTLFRLYTSAKTLYKVGGWDFKANEIDREMKEVKAMLEGGR